MIAGLLALFTAGVTTGQAVQALAEAGLAAAAGVTLVFIVLQALAGFGLIRLSLGSSDVPGRGARVAAAALAVGCVVVWAGYLIGPILAGTAALAPPYRGSPRAGGSPADESGSATGASTRS